MFRTTSVSAILVIALTLVGCGGINQTAIPKKIQVRVEFAFYAADSGSEVMTIDTTNAFDGTSGDCTAIGEPAKDLVGASVTLRNDKTDEVISAGATGGFWFQGNKNAVKSSGINGAVRTCIYSATFKGVPYSHDDSYTIEYQSGKSITLPAADFPDPAIVKLDDGGSFFESALTLDWTANVVLRPAG